MALTERLEDASPEPMQGAYDDVARLRGLVRRILESAGTDHDATEELELGLPGTVRNGGHYPPAFLGHAVLLEVRSFVSAMAEEDRLMADDVRLRSALLALDSPRLPGDAKLRLGEYVSLPFRHRVEGLGGLLDIDLAGCC